MLYVTETSDGSQYKGFNGWNLDCFELSEADRRVRSELSAGLRVALSTAPLPVMQSVAGRFPSETAALRGLR